MLEEKISVLIAALEERYGALRVIRSRVENIGLWSLGIMLGAGGWLIQSEITISCFEKLLYFLGVVIAFIVLRYKYLEDLARGFKGQQRAAVRIEKALKLYEPKFYDDSEEPIYPKTWEHAGMEDGDGKFFNTTYSLLYIGFIFLLISILSTKAVYFF